MGLEILVSQHRYSGDAGDSGQHLADPEGAPPQAVHPQAFNDAPAQAVPGGVAQGHLAVILPLFGQEMQQAEAHHIPHTFIQESGVVVFPLAGDGIEQAHAEEAVGGCSEGLPVDEVAPAADKLANEEGDHHQVKDSGELHLFDFCKHRHADDGTDDAAIDGNAAVPDVEHGNGVGGVLVPAEGAVVDPGADNGEGGDIQEAVQNVIFLQAELLAPAAAVDHGQQQAGGQNGTVKMDGQGSQLQQSGGIDFQPQKGEGNG